MLLSNKTYDLLKWLVVIFMPAFAVFLKGVGDVYGWPIDQHVTFINVLTVFLGSLLQMSNNHYKRGGEVYGKSARPLAGSF